MLFCSLVSGFDNVHIRDNFSRLEKAIKYGNSAGDRYVSSLENSQSFNAFEVSTLVSP